MTHHDWHSDQYVNEWIARDATRDAQRRPLLARMMSFAGLPSDAAPRVLDVGGGYGLVTEEVFRAYPQARVTLQDYSEPMLDRARKRLAAHGDKVAYSLSDLRKAEWAEQAHGPFDLAVSAIAIHNLRKMDLIANAYRAIAELLVPHGIFLDCDHLDNAGGVDAHLAAMRMAGFADATCVWRDDHNAIVKAVKA